MSDKSQEEIKNFFGPKGKDGLRNFGIDFLYANGTVCCNPVNTEETAEQLMYEPVYQLFVNKNMVGGPENNEINGKVIDFFKNVGAYHGTISVPLFDEGDDININKKIIDLVEKNIVSFETLDILDLQKSFHLTDRSALNIKNIIDTEPIDNRVQMIANVIKYISFTNRNDAIYKDIYNGITINDIAGAKDMDIDTKKLTNGLLRSFYGKNVANYFGDIKNISAELISLSNSLIQDGAYQAYQAYQATENKNTSELKKRIKTFVDSVADFIRQLQEFVPTLDSTTGDTTKLKAILNKKGNFNKDIYDINKKIGETIKFIAYEVENGNLNVTMHGAKINNLHDDFVRIAGAITKATDRIKEIFNVGRLSEGNDILKKTIFNNRQVPVFVNFIPYVPGSNHLLLKDAYTGGYFSKGTITDVKVEIDKSKYFRSLLKLARTKPTESPGSFSRTDFDNIIVNKKYQKPQYKYGPDNKLHLLNGDGALDAVVKDVDGEDYKKIMLNTDSATNENFVADCILTGDENGLKMCLDFVGNKNINDVAASELSLHPELAKQILKRFGFKKLKSTSMPESYGNWEFKMRKNFKEGLTSKREYEILFNNKGLLNYLKGVLNFVESNPDIMKKPNDTSVIDEAYGKKLGLIYERPIMSGGSKFSSANRAEVLRRGIVNHMASFSAEGLLSSPLVYNVGQSSQSGGCTEGELNKQIGELLSSANITVSDSDRNMLMDIAKSLRDKQMEIVELVNYIKKLRNVKSIYDRDAPPVRLNVHDLIANKKELDYLDDKINSNRECLANSVEQASGMCKELMNRYKSFSSKISTPYAVPFGNTDIETL